MKFLEHINGAARALSRPARGGWIEIGYQAWYSSAWQSPAPHGAGGLKFCGFWSGIRSRSPAPHGAGGLKSFISFAIGILPWSRPARGGWIEIIYRLSIDTPAHRPAPHGAGGLKFAVCEINPAFQWSRPARGGWIEILALVDDLIARVGPAPHGAGGLK